MRLFFLLFLLSWICGLAIGALALSPATLAVAIAAQVLITWWFRQPRMYAFTCLLLLLLGFIHGSSAASIDPHLCQAQSTATGRILGQPDIRANAARLRVALNDCIILVSVSPFQNVKTGDVISLSGGRVQTLAQVSDFSAGYAQYLKRQGIGGAWQYPDIRILNSGSEYGWRNLIRLPKLHDYIRLRIQKLFTEPDASMVTAFLLGEAGTLPAHLTEQFRATGVSHVLAISGSNIALLAAIAYTLLSLLPLPPWPRTIFIAVLLWLYIIFINLPL